MSAVDKATNVVTDVAADAAAEVAQHAEQMEQFIRSMNKTRLKFGLLGAAIGTAAGATATFVLVYRRAQTKYSKIADDEIAEMRMHYQAKIKASEATAQKLTPVKEIVAERGYAEPDEPPPMVVKPPTVERQEEPPPPVEVETRNVFEDADAVDFEWDWHEERKSRSPDIPYVIHYDERYETEGYSEVTLTFYDGDNVLCNERDEIVDPDDIDRLVGEKNLYRFGHGSNDAAIVYIRNDQLEILYEVIKSPNSYAEEVHGFSHDDAYRGNLERMRIRERDEQED
jgi:hypothetical protein